MKVAFVIGPYRASTIRGVVENIRAAEAVAIELWKLGFVALVPHLNTALFDGILPDEIWLEGARELLSRADIAVVQGAYNESAGSVSEIFTATCLGKPTYYWPEQRDEIAEAAK